MESAGLLPCGAISLVRHLACQPAGRRLRVICHSGGPGSTPGSSTGDSFPLTPPCPYPGRGAGRPPRVLAPNAVPDQQSVGPEQPGYRSTFVFAIGRRRAVVFGRLHARCESGTSERRRCRRSRTEFMTPGRTTLARLIASSLHTVQSTLVMTAVCLQTARHHGGRSSGSATGRTALVYDSPAAMRAG